MITAPVSRILAVADLGRSLAFYRDVLGFTTRENVVQSGAARIEFVAGDSAVDSTGERRPRGTAILFFVSDDVTALRHAVIACGGKPSELERVNRIKMRMVEIRDPDGHTLWISRATGLRLASRSSDRL